MTRLPPALVERLPPIVHEPREPRSSGKNRPHSSAAFWMVSSEVPARTVMVALAGSISSMPTMRSSEIATQTGQSTLWHVTQPGLPAGENRVSYAGRIDRPYDRERRLRQARAPVIAIARRDVAATG